MSPYVVMESDGKVKSVLREKKLAKQEAEKINGSYFFLTQDELLRSQARGLLPKGTQSMEESK